MEKSKNRIYRSIIEFEKTFYPASFEKRLVEQSTDARAIGIAMAKESLEKVRKQLGRR